MAASNQRYFTFVDRYLRVTFFETDPVIVTMFIGDEMDKKIDSFVETYKKATTLDKKKKLLSDLIGDENAKNIMERCEVLDSFALDQMLLFVQRSYIEGRSKNLNAAASGKTK